MSKLLPQLPSLVKPASRQPEGRALRDGAPHEASVAPEGANYVDRAELSAAARRRLTSSTNANVRLADPVALARQVADTLQHATDTGAVHRVAVAALSRLVK